MLSLVSVALFVGASLAEFRSHFRARRIARLRHVAGELVEQMPVALPRQAPRPTERLDADRPPITFTLDDELVTGANWYESPAQEEYMRGLDVETRMLREETRQLEQVLEQLTPSERSVFERLVSSHRHEGVRMSQFPRLAAALNLEALDDDQAVEVVKQLRLNAAAAEQERDLALGEIAELTAERDELRANGATVLAERIELAIDGAYRDGRLTYRRDDDGKPLPSPREARLRRLAGESFAEFETELAEMPVIVPVNKRVINEGAADVRAQRRIDGAAREAIESAAKQLGLDPDRMEEEIHGKENA